MFGKLGSPKLGGATLGHYLAPCKAVKENLGVKPKIRDWTNTEDEGNGMFSVQNEKCSGDENRSEHESTLSGNDEQSSIEDPDFDVKLLQSRDKSDQECEQDAVDYLVNMNRVEPITLMTIPVRLQGASDIVDALLDTGSSCCVVRSDYLGATEFQPCEFMIRGLGCSPVRPVGTISLDIQLGDLHFNEKFLVLPPSATSYSMILGNSFFEKYKVKLDFPHKVSGSSDYGAWEYIKELDRTILRDFHGETKAVFIVRNIEGKKQRMPSSN